MKAKLPVRMWRVVGPSMEPTLSSDKLVLGSQYFNLRKNDIVIFSINDIQMLKRVDKIKNDKVYVLGDNKTHSLDSRRFGWIDQSSVIAKVVWPRS